MGLAKDAKSDAAPRKEGKEQRSKEPRAHAEDRIALQLALSESQHDEEQQEEQGKDM